MKHFIVTMAALALCACGSSASQSEAKAGPALASADASTAETAEEASKIQRQLEENRRRAGYKCYYQAITGSRIKKKICSTAAARSYTRHKAREAMEQLNGSGCHLFGGGCAVPEGGPAVP